MHLHPEALFLLQAIILIGLPYTVWKLKFLKGFFPLVVIQICIGVLLGPSVFGRLAPDAFHFLFPKESLAVINGLSWLAIVFFGFLTGLHFDVRDLKGKGASFLSISLSSVLLPIMVGTLAGWILYYFFPELTGSRATQLTFALGIGISAGVTALPVLSAILLEMGLITKPLGKTVLGFATVTDGLLWVFVSVLLTLVSDGGNGYSGVIKTVVLLALYMLVMLFFIRPLVLSFVKKKIWTIDPDNVQLVMVVVLLLLSALATELIGIHYLLGAFIMGALIPKEIASALYKKKEPLVLVALLPFFFIVTGLRTNADLSNGLVWIVFGIMSAVTILGKFLSTFIPAKMFNYPTNTAMMFGGFMLCKGLMDIVVLNVLLNGDIISAICFSGMVLIAITNTTITKPFVSFLQSRRNGSENE